MPGEAGAGAAAHRSRTAPPDEVHVRVHARWEVALAVAVGGALGGGARMGLSTLFGRGDGLPWGTAVANVVGALLLGFVLTRLLRARETPPLAVPLLCTGLLGGFTTFSTFSLETWQLLEDGRAPLAVGYALGSVVLGLLAAATGIRLAERGA